MYYNSRTDRMKVVGARVITHGYEFMCITMYYNILHNLLYDMYHTTTIVVTYAARTAGATLVLVTSKHDAPITVPNNEDLNRGIRANKHV